MVLLGLIVATLALVFMLVRQALLRRQLRRMAEEIHSICEEGSLRRLRVESGDKAVAELAVVVDGVLAQLWEERAAHKEARAATARGMADISHDLRTPLTAIMGYLRLMEREAGAGQREDYLATAQERSESLRRMVDSLFEYTRLETGDYSFEPGPVEVNGAVAEVLAGMFAAFTEKGVEPEVRLAGGPLKVLADKAALERVLVNLLGNCLKHGEGTVEIETRAGNGRAAIRVVNGAGELAEEDVEHLFERSYTADKARTAGSTGLGLAIVKGLVEGMGGEVAAGLDAGRLAVEVWLPLLAV